VEALVSASIHKYTSAVARASRQGMDPERLREARRDLAAEKLAAYVATIVEQAPPLLPEQRERIIALLTAGGGSR
jgi:hypothetical protein